MSVFLNEIQPEPRLVIPRQWTSVYKPKIIWCYSSFRIFPLSPKTFLLILVKGVSWRTYQVPDNHSSQHYYCPHVLQKVENFIWRRSDSMVDFQNCGSWRIKQSEKSSFKLFTISSVGKNRKIYSWFVGCCMADQDLHLTRAVDIYFLMNDLQIWTADIYRY